MLLLAVLMECVLLTGCLRDQMHQKPFASAPPVVFMTTSAVYRDVPATEPDAKRVTLRDDRNHATVEFLENGTYADENCRAPIRQPCQMDDAVQFVHDARMAAKEAGKHLTVILFVHGNENNATNTTDNYPHFRQLLNCMNLGEAAYQAKYALTKKVLRCDGFPDPGGERYVGIFLGWRGRSNVTPFNLRQRVAFQIGNGPAVVPTLYRLRDAAKDNRAEAPSARFFAVGHSFGGLLLEQAAIRIYREAYDRTDDSAGEACAGETGRGMLPFADGIVTINAAVNSVPAERLIEYLRSKPFCETDASGGAGVARGMYAPILVSLLSKDDFWSSKTGSVLRHTFGHERSAAMGRPLANLQGTTGLVQGIPGYRDVYQSTPAHTTYLQNLCFFTGGFTPGEEVCENEMVPDPHGSSLLSVPANGQALPGRSGVAEQLHVRYACRAEGNTRTLTVGGQTPPDCGTTDPAQDRNKLLIWNTTPYWVGAIDREVIRGHDDFWNVRFASLVQATTFARAPREADELIATPASSGRNVPPIAWETRWPGQ